MDLDLLVTFVEVAKQGNFSRAAAKVFRSQPAVSAQIRQLESEYKQRLFDRSGKRVRLTPAGEQLLDYAQQMLRVHRESLHAVAEKSGPVRGALTIGANEATFLYVLPDVFRRFHRKYPEVRLDIYRNFSHKVLQKIEDGSLDVGIVTLPIRNAMMRAVPIFRDELVLAVCRDNKLQLGKTVTADEIARLPIIVPRTGYIRRVMDRYLRPYRTELRISMELASVVMIKQFVADGFGVSLISPTFAREEARAGKIKLIPIADLNVSRQLGLVYRRDRSLPRVAQAFIELTRERFRAAPHE